MIGRRGLLRAAPLLLFAPAIVRAESLMPVSVQSDFRLDILYDSIYIDPSWHERFELEQLFHEKVRQNLLDAQAFYSGPQW